MKTLCSASLWAGSLVALLGCGHLNMRGSVVMKTSDTEAHICLGRGEVAAGDTVVLVRHACRGKGDVPHAPGLHGNVPLQVGQCARQVLGRGQVVQLLNDHYSVARFPSGVPIEEGATVEREGR